MTFTNLGNHICQLLFSHLSTSWKTEGGPSSTWVGCCHLDLTLAKPYILNAVKSNEQSFGLRVAHELDIWILSIESINTSWAMAGSTVW